MNSPARVSRRTVRPWSEPLVLPGRPGFLRGLHPFRAAPYVAVRFQALFTPLPGVLFSFPSRYLVRYRSRDVFSLGSRFLPASHGNTKPWYSAPRRGPPWFRLRGCHPLRRAIPGHFGYHGSARWGSNPQPWSRNPSYPHGYPVGDWFGLSPFRSPLLRGSLLLSFPPPTKMFPFGGFPPGTPLAGFPGAGGYSPPAGGPIRGSRVQRLHAPTPGISPLAAPFVGARAEPSTGRRRCRWALGGTLAWSPEPTGAPWAERLYRHPSPVEPARASGLQTLKRRS